MYFQESFEVILDPAHTEYRDSTKTTCGRLNTKILVRDHETHVPVKPQGNQGTFPHACVRF